MKPKYKKILTLGTQGEYLVTEQISENKRTSQRVSPFLLEASEIGFSIAVPISAGALLGVFLDKRFETAPIFTLIFLCIGVVIAFAELFVLVRRFGRKRK
ncbi:MAG: AtpZ/AtpI family protein [bacterium]|nr:AtpZ/AtpI family protein [bacterium]